MDGRGRWLDNVFIERLWRSVKHEEVYLKAYENLTEARRELGGYFDFYEHYDAPVIFNSDQGSQFTCEGFTSRSPLPSAGR